MKATRLKNSSKIAFDYLGLDYERFITTDEMYYRPAEIHNLVADASKARTKLGWNSNYRFVDLVQEMVESDLRLFQRNPEGMTEKKRPH